MNRVVTGSPIGFGCMRLSTARDRDQHRSIATMHAALDAGATLLDTADAYAVDDSDTGHNERLIANALSTWGGDRTAVRIATKGGMTRPGGRWVPDGRASHLVSACQASLAALGVECIDLYQLHAPDPRVPLATSVRALAELRDRGVVRAIGLCNVNLWQLEQALAVTEIDAVQVELSWFADDAIRGGLVEYCAGHGIELIAHSPLGSPRRSSRHRKNRVLKHVAGRLGAEPAAVALAYLRDLSPCIVPIPGASRPETARASCQVQTLALGRDDRETLDAEFSASAVLRSSRDSRAPTGQSPAEVVVLMGIPGAGKSTAARQLESRGYLRLNRDCRGGTLAGLAGALDEELAGGADRVVVDSTYPSRSQRNLVIETAWQHGAKVRCEWFDTSIEDAQINVVARMLDAHGRLLAGDELRQKVRGDDTLYLPEAQFRFRRVLEPPSLSEGFESVKQRVFDRQWGPEHTKRAVIVHLDGVIRAERPIDPDDVAVIASGRDLLCAFADAGWLVLGTAWQPELASGKTTADAVRACLSRTFELIGHEFRVAVCGHADGPARCWCRKPLPGLGVQLIVEETLDPEQCIHVGRKPPDRTWAERLGFRYVDAAGGFGELLQSITS